jgi:iron(III) transport system ATP-binding protein
LYGGSRNRIIAGFDVPDRGRIALGGQPLTNGARAVPAHERGIGVVAQDSALFPNLSVGENVGFDLSRRDLGRPERIAEMLEMVELDGSICWKGDRTNYPVASSSGWR